MANEFWRGLKPVAEVFRPGAAPEAYVHDAATLDERWYAPPLGCQWQAFVADRNYTDAS